MTLETLKTSPPIPSGLSKSLTPRAGLFHDMPEAHLRLIGGLMGQLNPLFEETFNIDAQSYGEFNSYDGIDMRGDIERLMPSEWLWRDLVPEEFLRRFAEQELFYHKPSFETPTDERTHLVAIDCGPGMLGRPRLIALAALLSLSAIARRQGAKLLWTAPQADIADWQTLLTRKDLQAFLLAANPVSLEESQLDSLLQKLPGKSSEAELMLWMIGSKKLVLGDDTIKSNQVIISERMAIDADEHPFAEVSIRLHSYFGRVKEATLSYPPEEDCVSLLREPFRPRRMKTVRKLTNEREANPSWAPQGILLFPDVNKMIVRIKEGLLLLRLGPLDGGFHEPLLIPIKSFDNILGLRLIHDQLTIALTRKYNGFSQLTLKRFTCRPGPRNVADDIAEVRLDQNDPLAVDKHPRNALPALLKPGRKFRLLAMTSKGEQYVIQKHAVKPHGQLSHLSIIGMRDHWAFTLAGTSDKRLILARNLVSSKCISFALPEKAAVTGLNDIIHWPMELRTDGSCFLLARCNDGHWRGRRGKEGIVPYGDFSETSVDVDLSDIEDAVPLGHYKQQRGKPPYPAYRMCFVNPADGARVYCGFTLAGRVDIEPLDEAGLAWLEGIAPESRNNEAVLNIVLYKSWPMSWIIDKQGFVVSIRRHEPIDETTFGKTPKSFSVADFLSRATCHSE